MIFDLNCIEKIWATSKKLSELNCRLGPFYIQKLYPTISAVKWTVLLTWDLIAVLLNYGPFQFLLEIQQKRHKEKLKEDAGKYVLSDLASVFHFQPTPIEILLSNTLNLRMTIISVYKLWKKTTGTNTRWLRNIKMRHII